MRNTLVDSAVAASMTVAWKDPRAIAPLDGGRWLIRLSVRMLRPCTPEVSDSSPTLSRYLGEGGLSVVLDTIPDHRGYAGATRHGRRPRSPRFCGGGCSDQRRLQLAAGNLAAGAFLRLSSARSSSATRYHRGISGTHEAIGLFRTTVDAPGWRRR